MGDLEKPEDSGFESTLSSYLKGGSRSKQGGFILLIISISAIYFGIKMIPDFRNILATEFLIKMMLFPFMYVLYLAFKGDEPEEEA